MSNEAPPLRATGTAGSKGMTTQSDQNEQQEIQTYPKDNSKNKRSWRRAKLEVPKSRWTNAEDKILLNTINSAYGTLPPAREISWVRFKNCIPGRSCLQLRERYMHVLDPSIDKNTLAKSEILPMLRHRQTFGNKWTTIAHKFPGRTALAVKNAYYTIRRKFKRAYGREPGEGELIKFYEELEVDHSSSSYGSRRGGSSHSEVFRNYECQVYGAGVNTQNLRKSTDEEPKQIPPNYGYDSMANLMSKQYLPIYDPQNYFTDTNMGNKGNQTDIYQPPITNNMGPHSNFMVQNFGRFPHQQPGYSWGISRSVCHDETLRQSTPVPPYSLSAYPVPITEAYPEIFSTAHSRSNFHEPPQHLKPMIQSSEGSMSENCFSRKRSAERVNFELAGSKKYRRNSIAD